MMCIWAGLTMVTASVHSPGSIMAIRFFQGLAEASTFVGTHYILGAWYTERELGKRSGIFTASGLAGTLYVVVVSLSPSLSLSYISHLFYTQPR